MNYYQLTHIGANRAEIGIAPQSTSCLSYGDIQRVKIPTNEPIAEKFELPVPILEKKARPSTMISVVAVPYNFLILKSYFIEFIQEFTIPEFQFWPLEVHHKRMIITDYNLFLINSSLQGEIIDFNKSQFRLGSYKDFTWSGESIQVMNYKNYLSCQEVLKDEDLWLRTQKLVVNLENIEFDFFRLNINSLAGYFISEKLKNAIEKERFTGMVFKEMSSLKKVEVLSG